MFASSRFLAVFLLAGFFATLCCGQELDTPFAPGDKFSISHTPMNAKLVPLDCQVKKIPVHSYKHAGNEATFLIPEDSPTCNYEVLGTRIRVVRSQEKQTATAEIKPVKPSTPAPK